MQVIVKYFLIFLAVIMFFYIPSLAHAENGFTKEDNKAWTILDTSLQVVFLTMLAIDRGQTLAIHDANRQEIGFAQNFIGSEPSSGQVNRYFATCALLHTGIAIILPKPWRSMWQSVWIGAEISTINSNVHAGVSIRF